MVPITKTANVYASQMRPFVTAIKLFGFAGTRRDAAEEQSKRFVSIAV